MENVNVVQEQIDAEDVALIEKMKSSARAARDLSDVATSESQQLLQLFGIPYVVSPQVNLFREVIVTVAITFDCQMHSKLIFVT